MLTFVVLNVFNSVGGASADFKPRWILFYPLMSICTLYTSGVYPRVPTVIVAQPTE